MARLVRSCCRNKGESVNVVLLARVDGQPELTTISSLSMLIVVVSASLSSSVTTGDKLSSSAP
jgi:hypothetical protein